MGVQSSILGIAGSVAGAAVGIGSIKDSKASKQEQAATKARKAMQDELQMKLTQEQIKGEKLLNKTRRLKLRNMKARAK